MKLEEMEVPIQSHARAILEMVRASPVCIVEGAAGSGKTTLLPYLMYRGGLAGHGKIACVLPTRPAAVLASEFVGELLQDSCADIVGHQVRGNMTVSRETKIVYMTEGVLANAIRLSSHLDRYTVIIIDEVHERKMHYDFLLGYLKSLLALRPDLKVILSSATMRTAELSAFFGGVPHYKVSGTMFPVDVVYHEPLTRRRDPYAYLKDIAQVVKEIYTSSEEHGHCLVFLPGAAEIYYVERLINMLHLSDLMCVPFHGRLEREDRLRVFEETDMRKVVLATNIAETSLTIKGVAFVIDSGIAREAGFNPSAGTRSLYVRPISQSSAIQRAGRAGRTGPGQCHRMYSEASFAARSEYAQPAIARDDVTDLVFLLLELGVKYPDQLDLPTPITSEQSECAVARLQQWGVVDIDRHLTPFGEKVAWIGADSVQASQMLLRAADAGVGTEAAEVAAYLSILKFNDRDASVTFKLGGKHQQFADPRGDPITFLRMLRAYAEHRGDASWCTYQGLDARLLEESLLMRDKLVERLEALGYQCARVEQNLEKVHRALVCAWGGKLCAYDRQKRYRCGDVVDIKYLPPDEKNSGYAPYMVAFGLMRQESGLRMVNAITVPEDMVDEAVEVYGDPNIVTKQVTDGMTLRASGVLRIETPLAKRVVRLDVDCARSPSRVLRMVSGNAMIMEESRVPLRWMRISEAAQIELARYSISTLADCPRSHKALFESGLPEWVCQEVLGALTQMGYIPQPPETSVVSAETVQQDDAPADAEVVVEEPGEEKQGDWLFEGLLQQSVKVLGLPSSTVMRLFGAGLRTVGDLANLERGKLRNACGAQDRVADEVIARLEEFGIELESGAEKRQLLRMLEGAVESGMEIQLTEAEARKHLGDVDYDRFMRYRSARVPADRIAARNEILCAHRMLAGSAAMKKRSALDRAQDKALDVDDLMQEATFGLMTAIARFEPRSGYRFSTYAFQWMDQAMTRLIANQGVMRFPVHIREEMNRFGGALMAFVAKHGREGTVSELAAELNTSPERIQFLQELYIEQRVASLDAPLLSVEDGDVTLGERLSSNLPTPEALVTQMRATESMRKALDKALDSINVGTRNCVMFRARHGLDGDGPKTLEAVGDMFGITRERVRQCEIDVFKALDQPHIKEILFAATPWAHRFRNAADDLAATLVVDEETAFERRPEVMHVRALGAEILKELDAVLAELPVSARSIKAFRLHYGLDGEAALTLEEVGVRFGVTRQRAHQMYNSVLKELYTKEVWERMRRVMPSLAQPRRVIEPFAEIRETGSADAISLFVAPLSDLDAQVREILETIALRAHLSPRQLKTPSRKREVVQARWLAMVILRDHLDLSYPDIGRHLGGMDHSSVMYGYEQGKRLFGNITWNHPLGQEVTDGNQGGV